MPSHRYANTVIVVKLQNFETLEQLGPGTEVPKSRIFEFFDAVHGKVP